MPGLDLASLVNGAIAQSAGLDDSIARLDTLNKAGQDVANSQMEESRRAGEAASEIKRIELTEAARQKKQMNELALKLGGDPTKPGSFILQAAKETQDGFVELKDAQERIHAKQSTNFLANPLGWLVNQATIGGDIADYNAAARKINAADDMATQMASLQDLGNKQIIALSSTVSDAFIKNSSILAAHQYTREATDAALAGIRMNTEGIMHAAAMRKEQIGLLFQANTAIQQQKQIDISLQHLQISKAEFDLKADAKRQQKSEEEVALGYIAQGYFNLTGRLMPDNEKVNALAKMKFKDPRITTMFDSGLQSSMLGGKPVISTSPFQASDTIATGQVTGWASPSMKEVGEQLVTWRREFESQPLGTQTYDPKDKTGKEKAFNDFVRAKLSNSEQYPIFQPMKLTEITKINKNLANLPVWKNVLEPAAKTGVNVDDANTAFSIITAAAAEGKLSYVDAVDYSNLVGGALLAKNQANNLLAFGISPPKSYNQQIKLTEGFGRDRVNVVDQQSFARAFNKAMSIRATTVMDSDFDHSKFAGGGAKAGAKIANTFSGE